MLGEKKIGANVPTAAEAAEAVTGPDGWTVDTTGAGDTTHTQTFDLDYVDKRGHRWRGRFTTHILTMREQVQIGLVRARMAGGVSPDQLDVLTANMLEMLAHLTIAVDEAPAWFKNIENFRDQVLLEKIYAEVAQHERRFHGTE